MLENYFVNWWYFVKINTIVKWHINNGRVNDNCVRRRRTLTIRVPFMMCNRSVCHAISRFGRHLGPTPRQNVYACVRLSISGLFFSHTFQSKSPARFILCAACGSVVLLYAARLFDYFVVIETAFMDNQAQITETISRLDSEKVRW